MDIIKIWSFMMSFRDIIKKIKSDRLYLSEKTGKENTPEDIF